MSRIRRVSFEEKVKVRKINYVNKLNDEFDDVEAGVREKFDELDKLKNG